MERRYDFSGTAYVDDDILKETAEDFLENEGKDKDYEKEDYTG